MTQKSSQNNSNNKKITRHLNNYTYYIQPYIPFSALT